MKLTHALPTFVPPYLSAVSCWCAVSLQGNVVSGTAPGTLDSAVAINPDGERIKGPADVAAKEVDKEHAEMLLQVSHNEPCLLAWMVSKGWFWKLQGM